jgi:hypothetical protein
MADSRIKDLTVEPNKDFDQSLGIDITSYSSAKQMTLETLLRSGIVLADTDIGSASGTISFADYDVIVYTVSQDYALTISNVPDNSRNILKINKSSGDIITFVGVGGTEDSTQTGLTALYFDVISYNGYVHVKQINNQFEDTAVNLTSSDGTIISTSYFESQINNNICNFEASFVFDPTASLDDFTIDIANWGVTKKQTGSTPCSVFLNADGTIINNMGRISATALVVNMDSATTDEISVTVNGSFQIT